MWGLRQAYQDARAETFVWRDRYDALMAQYVAMVETLHKLKRDGFTIPEPERPPPDMPDLPLTVQAAIQARAMDRRMAIELEQWARVQLAAGDDPGAVEQRLWEGDAT